MHDNPTQDTHTIQVWPSGHGYQYRGDPAGAPEQRQLRTEYRPIRPGDWDGPACLRWLAEYTEEPNHYAARAADWAGEVARCAAAEDEDPEAWEDRAADELRAAVVERGEACSWHEGTPDEWREILHSVRALRYQDRDVLCCDSCLVDDLIKAANSGELTGQSMLTESAGGTLSEGFSYDEIRHIYPDPDGESWDAAQCKEWLDDHGYDTSNDRGDSFGVELTALRDRVRDASEPAEIMEWWRITSWLCDQLHAIGEVTIDNGYGHWWGRCATGQQYIMDGVLQRVAAEFDEVGG